LKGVKNGELLRAAQDQAFDVLITVDRKIPFQQNLANVKLSGAHPGYESLPLSRIEIAGTKALESLQQILHGEVITTEYGINLLRG
jgi:hypothetical protein